MESSTRRRIRYIREKLRKPAISKLDDWVIVDFWDNIPDGKLPDYHAKRGVWQRIINGARRFYYGMVGNRH